MAAARSCPGIRAGMTVAMRLVQAHVVARRHHPRGREQARQLYVLSSPTVARCCRHRSTDKRRRHTGRNHNRDPLSRGLRARRGGKCSQGCRSRRHQSNRAGRHPGKGTRYSPRMAPRSRCPCQDSLRAGHSRRRHSSARRSPAPGPGTAGPPCQVGRNRQSRRGVGDRDCPYASCSDCCGSAPYRPAAGGNRLTRCRERRGHPWPSARSRRGRRSRPAAWFRPKVIGQDDRNPVHASNGLLTASPNTSPAALRGRTTFR